MNRSAPSAVEIARAVRRGRMSARRSVEDALARIAAIDPDLNAFTVVRRRAALREAEQIDRAGAALAGPLAGVPVAVKEEYDVAGEVTTLGGRGNTAPADADCAVVQRLRAAGAVIVGRTNMSEFGQFPATQSALHGACLNPWDPSRSPGGSSGGSAVAVATGMVPVAMGSDGGGSLRIPASACGVVGLKPARGRVSSAPLDEHWLGLAGFGAITRGARDMALVMDVISGSTAGDRWRTAPPTRPFAESAEGGTGALRVLAASNPVMPGAGVAAPVGAAMRDFAQRLRALGHDVRGARVAWPTPTAAFLALYFAGVRRAARAADPRRSRGGLPERGSAPAADHDRRSRRGPRPAREGVGGGDARLDAGRVQHGDLQRLRAPGHVRPRRFLTRGAADRRPAGGAHGPRRPAPDRGRPARGRRRRAVPALAGALSAGALALERTRRTRPAGPSPLVGRRRHCPTAAAAVGPGAAPPGDVSHAIRAGVARPPRIG